MKHLLYVSWSLNTDRSDTSWNSVLSSIQHDIAEEDLKSEFEGNLRTKLEELSKLVESFIEQGSERSEKRIEFISRDFFPPYSETFAQLLWKDLYARYPTILTAAAEESHEDGLASQLNIQGSIVSGIFQLLKQNKKDYLTILINYFSSFMHSDVIFDDQDLMDDFVFAVSMLAYINIIPDKSDFPYSKARKQLEKMFAAKQHYVLNHLEKAFALLESTFGDDKCQDENALTLIKQDVIRNNGINSLFIDFCNFYEVLDGTKEPPAVVNLKELGWSMGKKVIKKRLQAFCKHENLSNGFNLILPTDKYIKLSSEDANLLCSLFSAQQDITMKRFVDFIKLFNNELARQLGNSSFAEVNVRLGDHIVHHIIHDQDHSKLCLPIMKNILHFMGIKKDSLVFASKTAIKTTSLGTSEIKKPSEVKKSSEVQKKPSSKANQNLSKKEKKKKQERKLKEKERAKLSLQIQAQKEEAKRLEEERIAKDLENTLKSKAKVVSKKEDLKRQPTAIAKEKSSTPVDCWNRKNEMIPGLNYMFTGYDELQKICEINREKCQKHLFSEIMANFNEIDLLFQFDQFYYGKEEDCWMVRTYHFMKESAEMPFLHLIQYEAGQLSLMLMRLINPDFTKHSLQMLFAFFIYFDFMATRILVDSSAASDDLVAWKVRLSEIKAEMHEILSLASLKYYLMVKSTLLLASFNEFKGLYEFLESKVTGFDRNLASTSQYIESTSYEFQTKVMFPLVNEELPVQYYSGLLAPFCLVNSEKIALQQPNQKDFPLAYWTIYSKKFSSHLRQYCLKNECNQEIFLIYHLFSTVRKYAPVNTGIFKATFYLFLQHLENRHNEKLVTDADVLFFAALRKAFSEQAFVPLPYFAVLSSAARLMPDQLNLLKNGSLELIFYELLASCVILSNSILVQDEKLLKDGELLWQRIQEDTTGAMQSKKTSLEILNELDEKTEDYSKIIGEGVKKEPALSIQSIEEKWVKRSVPLYARQITLDAAVKDANYHAIYLKTSFQWAIKVSNEFIERLWRLLHNQSITFEEMDSMFSELSLNLNAISGTHFDGCAYMANGKLELFFYEPSLPSMIVDAITAHSFSILLANVFGISIDSSIHVVDDLFKVSQLDALVNFFKSNMKATAREVEELLVKHEISPWKSFVYDAYSLAYSQLKIDSFLKRFLSTSLPSGVKLFDWMKKFYHSLADDCEKIIKSLSLSDLDSPTNEIVELFYLYHEVSVCHRFLSLYYPKAPLFEDFQQDMVKDFFFGILCSTFQIIKRLESLVSDSMINRSVLSLISIDGFAIRQFLTVLESCEPDVSETISIQAIAFLKSRFDGDCMLYSKQKESKAIVENFIRDLREKRLNSLSETVFHVKSPLLVKPLRFAGLLEYQKDFYFSPVWSVTKYNKDASFEQIAIVKFLSLHLIGLMSSFCLKSCKEFPLRIREAMIKFQQLYTMNNLNAFWFPPEENRQNEKIIDHLLQSLKFIEIQAAQAFSQFSYGEIMRIKYFEEQDLSDIARYGIAMDMFATRMLHDKSEEKITDLFRIGTDFSLASVVREDAKRTLKMICKTEGLKRASWNLVIVLQRIKFVAYSISKVLKALTKTKSDAFIKSSWLNMKNSRYMGTLNKVPGVNGFPKMEKAIPLSNVILLPSHSKIIIKVRDDYFEIPRASFECLLKLKSFNATKELFPFDTNLTNFQFLLLLKSLPGLWMLQVPNSAMTVVTMKKSDTYRRIIFLNDSNLIVECDTIQLSVLYFLSDYGISADTLVYLQ